VILLLLSPLLAGLTAAIAGVQVFMLVLSRQRYAALASQDLETQSRSQSYLAQMLVGIEALKAGGAEDRALETWANLYVDGLNVALQRSRLQAVLDSISGLLQTAAPLVLLGTGAWLVITGRLPLGTMLASTAVATGFLTPLASLVASALQLQVLGSYIERI